MSVEIKQTEKEKKSWLAISAVLILTGLILLTVVMGQVANITNVTNLTNGTNMTNASNATMNLTNITNMTNTTNMTNVSRNISMNTTNRTNVTNATRNITTNRTNLTAGDVRNASNITNATNRSTTGSTGVLTNTTNRTNVTRSNDSVTETITNRTRAFYAQGWAIGEDQAYLVQSLWFRNTDSDFNNVEDIPNGAGGVLQIDVGADAQKFHLVKIDSVEDTITYAVMPDDENTPVTIIDETDIEGAIGKLTLVRIPRSDVSLWEGLLSMDEGSLSDEYHIQLASRSIVIGDLQDASKLVEETNSTQVLEDESFLNRVLRRLGLR